MLSICGTYIDSCTHFTKNDIWFYILIFNGVNLLLVLISIKFLMESNTNSKIRCGRR